LAGVVLADSWFQSLGLGEERISEGLTARSFLIKAIFASSPAVVGLDILVAATLKKYKKEQQDSFSIITQTEHLAVLLKW
jgi:hypothetical protein